MISFDTETCLIRPGKAAPELVCLSWHDGKTQGVVPHHEGESLARAWLEDQDLILGLNVAFDMAVLGAEYPRLLPLIFDAYRQGRVRDVALDQRMIDTAKGRIKFYDKKKGSYSLEGLVKRRLGEDLSKDDSPRLTYGELRFRPLADYSPEQIRYAELDAIYPWRLHELHVQDNLDWRKRFSAGLFENAPAQAYHAFALHLASCWGVRASKKRTDDLARELETVIQGARTTLFDAGLIRPDGTKNIAAASAYMTQVWTTKGMDAPRTDPSKKFPQGQVKLDKETTHATGDTVMQAYSTYVGASTLATRVQDLSIGAYVPLQPSYHVMKDTGRTSASKPGKSLYGFQIQNMPKLKGSRECLEPRPGCIFFGADIDAAEMHTLAQTLLDNFGWSKLAETLNAGRDPHTYFGGLLKGMTYEEAASLEKPALKALRTSAKPGNFGIPGGLGAAKFVLYAAGYDVFLTLEEARHHINTYKYVAYPEMAEYLKAIGRATDRGDTTVLFPWVKRWRGGLTYSSMANTFFQSRCADGALAALDEVQRRCYTVKSSALYGARIWGFIHDEVIGEVRIEQAAEAAEELGRVIGEEFNRFCPDVPTKASPALFWRWSKGVDPVKDESGRLTISDPENAPGWYKDAA